MAPKDAAPVLDPGRGRTKTGQLFAYARDDRPWGGIDPPGVAYLYAPDRKAEQPLRHLQGFVGILQVDGYAGYRALAERNGVSLAFCWSHVRRRFYELAQSGPAPIATEALQRIAELYRIENEIRGRSPEERRAARQQKSRPIIDALEPWLRGKLALVSQKSKLAEAIRYPLSRWAGLGVRCAHPRRRPRRHRLQRGRTLDQADRPQSEECALRRFRRRWRALGDDRLAYRNREAQWRRPRCLPRRRHHPHRRRPSAKPAR